MSEKYKANEEQPYFVTMIQQAWVDLFTREAYRAIFVNEFRYFHVEKGIVINEYVIMSKHVHLKCL